MDYWFVYRGIILEFLAELYVFYALCTRSLSRRPHFGLRAMLGTVGMLLLGLGVAFAYLFVGMSALGRIALYLLLFAVSTAHVALCFDEEYTSILLCCSIAYAAQNLVYKLFLVFFTAIESVRWTDAWGDSFDLIYHIVYYAFFALAALCAYRLFLKKITQMTARLNRKMLRLSLLTLLVTLVICSFQDVAAMRLSVGRENHFEQLDLLILRQTGNLLSIVACIGVLLLASRTLEHEELREEVAYLQHAIRQSELQYEISKDTIGMINIKCHDMKYKLATLVQENTEQSKDLIEDINRTISIYDAQIETNNKLLNVLLTEKSLYCEQNGINFSCMANGEKLGFMTDGDLYCLFGNIVDNALEAVRGISDKEKRVINLTVVSHGDLLIIREDNYFDGTLSFSDRLPVTTKDDRAYHGFGMRSIRMIANKYGGELTVSASDNMFHLSIVFPLQCAE